VGRFDVVQSIIFDQLAIGVDCINSGSHGEEEGAASSLGASNSTCLTARRMFSLHAAEKENKLILIL